jgi:predicted DsbA family dithiol-disulfide isomerase
MNKKKLVIYSDFICPFCYIGKVNAERLAANHPDIEIEWKEFELHPEGQPDPNSPYMKHAQENVNRLAEKYGIEMKADVLTTVTSESRTAMMGLHFAKEHGKLEQYREAVFHAYWLEGKDIGNLDILSEIAAGLQMDADKFRSAMEQETYLPLVVTEIDEARQNEITGVPTYQYGRHMTMGAQSVERLERFIQAVDDLQAAEQPEDEAPICGPDGCER